MSSDHFLHRLAGLNPDGEAAQALAARADLLSLTDATAQAVLAPREPGGLSHHQRQALAARIALLHQEPALAALHRQALPAAVEALADPAFEGGEDPRWRALLAHVDRVTLSPRDASGEDIAALREAGWAEADIVRLSELVAFLSYQIRLLAGLRLLEAQS